VSDATVLIISCGALAKEIVELRRLNGWSHIRIQCLPAELHNRPERIPGAVREAIEKYRDKYQQLFVAYGDCGTGGELDKVLEKFDIPRLPGAHCYEFYSGTMTFEALADDEPASFYLTDFLTQHFRRLVKEGLGLDRHPELMSTYFGNYKRLVYLSQSNSALLEEAARSNGKADLYLLAGHTRTGRRPGRAQVGFQERA
jgi:hypothetical protein